MAVEDLKLNSRRATVSDHCPLFIIVLAHNSINSIRMTYSHSLMSTMTTSGAMVHDTGQRLFRNAADVDDSRAFIYLQSRNIDGNLIDT